jgi:hypothetical protein
MEIDRKAMRATERRKIVLVSLTDTDKSYSIEDVSAIKNRTEITTQQLSLTSEDSQARYPGIGHLF